MDKKEWPQETEELLAAYKSHAVETSDGKQEKAANYINMIHLYHDVSRSIRTDDLDLFISSLPKITISSHSICQTMLDGQ